MATTPPATAARIRAVYRNLLRDLPPRSVLALPRSPLHQSLRASFDDAPAPRPHAPPTQSHNNRPLQPATRARLEQAEQLAAFTRAQRTYTALLERYNPGMAMDEEERVRRTARQVGLALPEEHDAGDQDKK